MLSRDRLTVMCPKMSSLPRSTGSFRKSRVVRLMSQLFRRRKEARCTPSITISSPHPVSTNFSTMSWILHCRRLHATDDIDAGRVGSLISESADAGFSDGDLSVYEYPDINVDGIFGRSASHESVLQQNIRAGKMNRMSRTNSKVERTVGAIAAGTATSLLDISNATLRSELESKIFVRAKRMNSNSNNDHLTTASRLRADSAPYQSSGTVGSSSSMVSFLSSSDVNQDPSAVLPLPLPPFKPSQEFFCSSSSSLFESSSSRHTQHHYDNNVFPVLPVQSQLLSHDAAKHRIAVKPKNRRPKNVPPNLDLLSKSYTSGYDDYDFNVGFRPDHVQQASATVVSEVQATYEVLKRVPEPLAAMVPEQTTRKASSMMTYSKSFNLPHRPATVNFPSSSSPIGGPKPTASPRLMNRRKLVGTGEAPPSVPLRPQIMPATSNEYMKVFSKFRKHIEPDASVLQQHAKWQESSSSATSSSVPLISQTSLPKASFASPSLVSDIIMVPDDIILETKPTGHSELSAPDMSSSQHTFSVYDVKSEKSVQVETTFPSYQSPRMAFISPNYSSTIEKMDVTEDLPAKKIDRTRYSSSSGLSDIFMRRASLNDEASSKLTLEPLRQTASNKPGLSPKPVPRQKLGNITQQQTSAAEQELFQVLAKRSANLRDIDGDNFTTGKTIDQSISSKPLAYKDHFPATTELRKNLDSKRFSTSFDKENEASDSYRKTEGVTFASLIGKNIPNPEKPVDFTPKCSSGAKFTKLQKKISFTEEPGGRVTKPEMLPTVPIRKSSFRNQVEPAESHFDHPNENNRIDPPSSNIWEQNESSLARITLSEVTGGSKESLPNPEREAPKYSLKTTPVPEKKEPVKVDTEQPFPSGGVSSRAAMFQQKVNEFKPLVSSRTDINRTISSSVPVASSKARSFANPVNDTGVAAPTGCLSVPKIATLASNLPPRASLWTTPIPAVPWEPAALPKLKAVAISSGTSGASSVPLWVIVAQEKRRRIGLLSESNNSDVMNSKQSSGGGLTAELHIVDASYA